MTFFFFFKSNENDNYPSPQRPPFYEEKKLPNKDYELIDEDGNLIELLAAIAELDDDEYD